MNKASAKLFVLLLKYLPVFRTLSFVIHFAITNSGEQEHWIDNIVRISPCSAFLMVVASYAFGFCKLHRHFTYYNFAVTCFIVYDEEFGMPAPVLSTLRPAAILLGMILLITLCIYRQVFIKKEDMNIFKKSRRCRNGTDR